MMPRGNQVNLIFDDDAFARAAGCDIGQSYFIEQLLHWPDAWTEPWVGLEA
jgi:hypothetical protein